MNMMEWVICPICNNKTRIKNTKRYTAKKTFRCIVQNVKRKFDMRK